MNLAPCAEEVKPYGRLHRPAVWNFDTASNYVINFGRYQGVRMGALLDSEYAYAYLLKLARGEGAQYAVDAARAIVDHVESLRAKGGAK